MKKVLFIDLDGTLIHTASGKTFPEGIWDMVIDFKVLQAIRKTDVKFVHIITNQGGIEKGLVNERAFMSKLRYIAQVVTTYCNIECSYDLCKVNNKDSIFRKPNIGMIESWWLDMSKVGVPINKEDCLMVGDASGLEGQFSDSDLKTAQNAGIEYMDVSEFINHPQRILKGNLGKLLN